MCKKLVSSPHVDPEDIEELQQAVYRLVVQNEAFQGTKEILTNSLYNPLVK
jgi:hypothetical protein